MTRTQQSVCPFSREVFIPEPRIERICLDALRSVGLLPSEPSPIRIDRFVEKFFSVEVGYDDLSKSYGQGVMGVCKFRRDGTVSQVLVDQGIESRNPELAELLLRSTMAHEAGHGLLHGGLFAEKFRADDEILAAGIIPARVSNEGIIQDGFACRGLERTPSRYDWWEVQANKAMASLLLPKALVMECLRTAMTIPAPTLKEVASVVARQFNVSISMATYRIESEFKTRQAQPELLL